MTLPHRIRHAWVRLCVKAKRLWRLHHAQMEANGRYARAFIQGIVRALWQDTLERFLGVLVAVCLELFRILREDGFKTGNAFSE